MGIILWSILMKQIILILLMKFQIAEKALVVYQLEEMQDKVWFLGYIIYLQRIYRKNEEIKMIRDWLKPQ